MLGAIPEVMIVPNFEVGGKTSFHYKDVPVPGARQLLLVVGANAPGGISELGRLRLMRLPGQQAVIRI